jgi:hypothetical protein
VSERLFRSLIELRRNIERVPACTRQTVKNVESPKQLFREPERAPLRSGGSKDARVV